MYLTFAGAENYNEDPEGGRHDDGTILSFSTRIFWNNLIQVNFAIIVSMTLPMRAMMALPAMSAAANFSHIL
jgi:hypothetical protein